MLDFASGISQKVESSTAIPAVSDFKAGSYVIDADSLEMVLQSYDTLVVDMRTDVAEGEGYIPGAVRLDYNELVRQSGVIEGLIPTPAAISKVLSSIGLKPWHFVVAYDDETGVEASRLLWSLACAGHDRFALLDGGYEAWTAQGLDVEPEARLAVTSQYVVDQYTDAVVHKHTVLSSLDDENVVLVDTRGAGEFSGEERRAEKGGHIPGAVNFNWMEAIDLFGDGGLREADALLTKFRAKGVTPDKHVIVYCQSNRRSAHTFVVLKWLGFENVRAYDGSWSEWGNDPSLPVTIR